MNSTALLLSSSFLKVLPAGQGSGLQANLQEAWRNSCSTAHLGEHCVPDHIDLELEEDHSLRIFQS